MVISWDFTILSDLYNGDFMGFYGELDIMGKWDSNGDLRGAFRVISWRLIYFTKLVTITPISAERLAETSNY